MALFKNSDHSLKFRCLSYKLSQYSLMKLEKKEEEILKLYNENKAYRRIVKNYQPIFQNHEIEDVISEKVVSYFNLN